MPEGAYSVTRKRARDAQLVVPLDELRATDYGILTSWGGALASGALYAAASGVEAFLMQVMMTPFSGAVGAIQLLDGTTVVSIPLVAIPQGSGAVGTQIIPMGGQRFLSSINVQTVSGLTPAIPILSNATPTAPLFAGAIQCVVMVDPKDPSEG